jgi:5'-nucleotidase / UDP-sugar diphosphatase
LYSLTCPLLFGQIAVTIPAYTKGKLTFVPKNKEGQPIKTKVEALDDPRSSTPNLLSPSGTMDQAGVVTMPRTGAVREIKEWQAIMDHLRSLPVKNQGELPVIPIDERAAEVRAIRAG